jgi:hypothetical protein
MAMMKNNVFRKKTPLSAKKHDDFSTNQLGFTGFK